jgi:hypothetical protein
MQKINSIYSTGKSLQRNELKQIKGGKSYQEFSCVGPTISCDTPTLMQQCESHGCFCNIIYPNLNKIFCQPTLN